MKSPLVIYFSRGGKTRKVAEAIAQELSCKAVDVKKETPDISDVGLLVVGSGNYGGKAGKELLEFLNGLKSSNEGKAAVFATSGGPEPKCILGMQDSLEKKDYKVVSSFKTRGQFLLFNRGRPNEDDLKSAREFAFGIKKLS